ncbi:IclR family transcriptional regulator [Sporosarcina sp. CAU 1771]
MNKNDNIIASVDNSLNILFSISENGNKSIRELSEIVGMSKSALHRILLTLERRGFVRQDEETKRYSLGFAILSLASALNYDLEISKLAIDDMKSLRNEVNETIQLAIVENNKIVLVNVLEGSDIIRIYSKVGKVLPITYGNFGKVFLSGMSHAKVLDYLEKYPLKSYGANTVTDINTYIEDLIKVRETGISVGVDDPIDGAYSIAAAIYDAKKQVVASLSLIGVKKISSMKNLPHIEKLVHQTAMNISNKIKLQTKSYNSEELLK